MSDGRREKGGEDGGRGIRDVNVGRAAPRLLHNIFTEFPVLSCREVFRIIFREFPCPAWAVASCRSGPQARGTP